MTKHHIIGTADVNGEWDFQIQQANEKENYKQIKTCLMFYIFTMHSTQYNIITNKNFFLLFSCSLFTLESKKLPMPDIPDIFSSVV